jgi:hypothetical protein
MATTLEQYWIDEVTRLDARLIAQKAEVTAQRTAVSAAQTAQRAAAKAVQTETDNVAAARKALAAIPMPADGDPLLVAMEDALVALAAAEVTLANADRDLLTATAELARKEAQLSSTEAARAEAERQRVQEQKARAARQVMIDRLTSGDLSTIAADAIAALTNEPTARARVESEFPTNATAAKNFLERVRARRGIVRDALKNAEGVEAAAFTAYVSALAKADRDFVQAVAAVRTVTEAAPRLAADSATLARLAALPAPNPPDYPILTRWQHERLHDATKKPDREDALAKLTDIDNAQVAVQTAQQTYDLALHAAMKAEPDKTQAELDSSTVSAQHDALEEKRGDLQDARDEMNAAERETVQTWFEAVPDKLWDELEKLDTARARLGALSVAPTPGDLINTMQTAETALTTALTNARATARQQDGADVALKHASGQLNAERETVTSRAKAYAHSAVPF